jgi:subtilisin family serine protease
MNKWKLVFPTIFVAGLLALLTPFGPQALAQSPDVPTALPVGSTDNETTDLWFVELSKPPLADNGSAAQLTSEKKAFRDSAKTAGLVYKERFEFKTLFNGFSVKINPANLSTLKSLAGVKAVYPVASIPIPENDPVFSPELYTSIKMIGADVAQTSLGFTGYGVKVGIIDTGIDYHHPDLGGCFGRGCRVAFGYDFVGDAFNADPASPSYNPVPVPDPDPDDCAGHGTHVSGIVGANGTVKGVAPEVTFGAYRVFGCQGSTTADIMIAAMERALADRVQVVNMSIGSAYQWPQYPTAMAANRLVKKGVVVVASIGNNGANGLYSAGAPGVGEKVIGVASYDNTQEALSYFTVTPDSAKMGYTPAVAAPAPPVAGTSDMARTGTKTSTADACAALPAGSLSGKVALIRRGTCSFNQKAFNAQSAGAIGVVLYNNTTGRVNPTVAGPPAITIPVVAITAADGALINDRLAVGSVTMTWTANIDFFPLLTGGLISSFSSYGLSPDLDLKPDIGAPGGSIYSTYPLALGGYASLSGTSMASPHVAGAAALYLQAHPGTSAEDVRSILQNTAVPANWSGNPGLGFLDFVHRQGAGMLHIDKAIEASVTIEPGKLALGESQFGPVTRTLKLQNDGGSAVTFNLSYVNALSTGGVITPSFWTSGATVAFSAPTVTVPAGGTATVGATITAPSYLPPPSGPDYPQYGGYIVFTPQGGGQVYRVPFAGFVGDYQSIQAVTPVPPYGFPWLAKLTGGSYVNQPGGATFTLVNGDVPYILVHLEHQVALLAIEIYDAATGKPVHPVFNKWLDLEYVGRNSTSTAFFAFAWDGQRIHSNGYNGNGYKKDLTKQVPNGTYILKLKALKALGDSDNPAHWETWTSPTVTLARP